MATEKALEKSYSVTKNIECMAAAAEIKPSKFPKRKLHTSTPMSTAKARSEKHVHFMAPEQTEHVLRSLASDVATKTAMGKLASTSQQHVNRTCDCDLRKRLMLFGVYRFSVFILILDEYDTGDQAKARVKSMNDGDVNGFINAMLSRDRMTIERGIKKLAAWKPVDEHTGVTTGKSSCLPDDGEGYLSR
ncbi:hypothetical protein CYMTET_55331 [Cymbomonas tetramitiformis]|uniref:Uncharacterized protein n=1 Tax=Cymbomonas tetramitiformis TaxID=36881 RepID=A0AAE0BE97_9CHLO|nr:hypothetical protein CYMTET_55331 [Cymbomonas tetramitiformis]